uniref:Uncharacterized protein n=1 Tax=Plectus sambesii TaxID=2011161 RepID=A0A914V6K4_9BILA
DPVLVEDVQLQCSINLSQQLHRSTQIGQSWFDRTDSQVQTAILSSDSVTQCSLLFDEEKAIQLSVSAQTDPSPVEETIDQVEFSCQTEVTPALDFFCQTEIVAESPRPEVKDDETQVDEHKVELADGECQADVRVLTEDHEVQVEMELPALPEKEVREMQVQVDLEEQAPEQTHQDCQTDIEEPVEEGAETTDSAVQVERWDVYDCSAQTESAEYVSVDAQTEDEELQEEKREEEKEDAPAPWADFETEDIIGLRMKLLDHTTAADTIENESQTETSLFAHDATQVELIMRDIETEMEVAEESQEIGVQSDLSSFDYRDSQTQSEEQEEEAGVDVSDATTQSEEIAFQFGQDEAVQPMLAPELSLQHQSTQTHEQQRASVATNETGTQLSTYFDRKTRRMQTLMSQKHVETQMTAEVEDVGVQSPNNWLQVSRRLVTRIIPQSLPPRQMTTSMLTKLSVSHNRSATALADLLI